FRISKIKLGYDERNVSRLLWGAAVFGRVAGGVRGSRGRPSSASAHESRADVSVFAWMAGKCVSYNQKGARRDLGAVTVGASVALSTLLKPSDLTTNEHQCTLMRRTVRPFGL